MSPEEVIAAHRIERCSVSTTEFAYQWGRCTGCDFASEYVPLKGVDWPQLQQEISAAHGVEALAAAGYAVVQLPEPTESLDPEIAGEWLGGEVMAFRDGHMEWDWHSIKPKNAQAIARALLAAAAAVSVGLPEPTEEKR